jgi:hypothetical protein
MKTHNELISYMKTTCCTIICLTALGLATALAQEPPPPAPPAPAIPPHLTAPAPVPPAGGFSDRLANIIQRASAPPAAESSLTKFDLDFPGGTPKDLVAAIEKATGRPLNAIVPDELANTKLPALKMNSVDVSQLFLALAAASRKSEAVISGTGYPYGPSSYQIANTSCGFRQVAEGRLTDDTIWYFYVDKPILPPLTSSGKVCRFYALAPYLDRGMSVDDITTAVETGWKMLGETSPPTISFHKDTKLLIAVGEPSKLEPIDAVLKALGSQMGGGGGGVNEPPKPRTAAPIPAPAAK